MSSILREFKQMEKSIADAVDKLGWVSPEKINQFSVLTYTEVANFSYLAARAKELQDQAYFPFTETIKDTKGNEIALPLTHSFGVNIETLLREYMQLKVSMSGRSRQEVYGVTKAFGGGLSQERQGLLARIKGGLGFH
jgi:hypothetical protein